MSFFYFFNAAGFFAALLQLFSCSRMALCDGDDDGAANFG